MAGQRFANESAKEGAEGYVMSYAGTMGHRRRQRGGSTHSRLLVAAIGLIATAVACAPVAWMLWPAPAAFAPDAPSIPVTIGGVYFNVPPAAIRFRVQRRPGAQPRVDLAFLWPSLSPPDASVKPQPTDTPDVTDRLFVTIAATDGTLAPLERLKTIYPRYLDAAPVVGADGLSQQGFRDNTAYQGEDLMLDPAQPERFLLRCTRQAGSTPAMCLHERRIGGAEITVRFPRTWLTDWRKVSDGIEKLIGSFKPSAT
jgi:hypothetical protein